jgi:HEAT repeat protein
MLDGKELKALGLRFARALHTTIKTAIIFTVDHRSVERPIQQSFEFLNHLLKDAGQFTFGFVDNQVMLNNLLTTDASLRQLETEFLKRGIAAVTFEPGLTLGRYKRVINLLSVSTKVIEDTGGLLVFLDQNEIEGARILPAARNQKKDEYGDTIIETDSETYILSKQMSDEQAPRDFLDSIDALLESACVDPSTRTDLLSNYAARGMDGSGYGVPIGMPNLAVVREGETVVPASTLPGAFPEGGSGSVMAGGAAHDGAARAATAHPVGFAESAGIPKTAAGVSQEGAGWGSRPFSGHGSGTSSGGSDGSLGHSTEVGAGIGAGPGMGVRGKGGHLGSGTFMELVETSVQRSLLEEKGNPQKSYSSLARILRNMGVDKILSQFPAERREELNSLPPEQLAAEYIEDTALQLAGAKLKSAGGQSPKILIEEEVVQVLARSLQATHMADRLAQKLAKFIQDFAVPPHVQEKIRDELHWASLNSSKKYARLMEIKHYSAAEFRRLMDLSKELSAQRDIDRAAALATHYFDFLDEEGVQIDITELSRAPELIRNIPLVHLGFASHTAERLGRTLLREDVPEFIHVQVASALTVLAQSIAAFEDFQNVLAIGVSLETSRNRNSEKHKKCCGTGLSRLLPPAAIERIIELFLLQRGDSAWSKTASMLLRFAAPASIETVFNHLILEKDARNRLALVRLVGQLGSGTVELAYKYLQDERWYVVRNMCGVLAELKDPELVEHIAPALQHPDARVQQAALKAVIKSRTAKAAAALSASLSKLAPNILEEALNELMFLKDVAAIKGLEELLSSGQGNRASSKKAVQALACISDDAALHSLASVFRMEDLDSEIRRAALSAICKEKSPLALTLLKELATTRGPLADEVRNELRKRDFK